jgi:SPP1 gp7 family putative phage head morphogenesis protein
MADPVIERKNIGYKEAIDYAHARNIVLPDEYYGKLVGVQRSQAVSVAGLASIEQIRFVVDQLEKTLKEGKTFKDFQDAVKANTLGIELPKHRLDNIFRTNVQAAYARGRWEQQTKVASTRPFLMYDAINDGRTRPHHHAMDGVIRPRTDPWWTTHYPPNGYRCRCTVISLSAAQAEKRGGPTQVLPDGAEPDEGWDYNPGADYLPPVKKAVEKAITKVVTQVPSATAVAQKAQKAIEKKAKPVTLNSVMAKGKAALAELAGDGAPEGMDFNERLRAKVIEHITGKPFDRKHPNADAFGAGNMKSHAQAVFPKGFSVRQRNPTTTNEEFKDKVWARLAIPKSWIKAVNDYYGTVNLEWSASRAYARQEKRNPTLSINPNRGATVLHEFMHLVQAAKPELQDLAEQLHKRRTAGTQQKKLKDLVPGAAYQDHEVAREDKYHNAYVGREYMSNMGVTTRATMWRPLEILTVGVESLVGDISDTATANYYNGSRRNLMERDREMAEFILGLLLSYD